MSFGKYSPKEDPLNAPVLGDAIPRWGNGFFRWVARGVLRLWGWRFAGTVPNLPKMVLIGVPHTSNWDFVLAMAVLIAVQARVYWLGKHTFVRGPLKPLLLKLGGVAVDRRAASGVVAQVTAQFQERDQFLLGLAPEGTRSLVSHWKMGFFHIARAAQVPILPVALDYGRKTIAIGEPVWPEGGETAMLAQLRSFYDGVQGKRPELFSLDSIQPSLRDR
ncbi:MAG: 1-acyl-sn-glycerol-3-phosphate acyltransferase [Anaerolineaceae bacterium]|nr:1-acyl-sn-glycerol-3-phosphate acyltransferase [Anaerolineaceae bacterium]